MKHLFPDGRELMVRYDDIKDFFDKNRIIGRTIANIKPTAFDYIIRDIGDIDNVYELDTESAIDTDGQICLIFEDDDNLEIEFSGDGPILLGFNTADFEKYPKANGNCYTLRTLFKHCLGHKVVDIVFERSDHRMLFPAYRGIDMSAYDEGIDDIKIVLDDGSYLLARGSIDYFNFEHHSQDGNELRVPFKELLSELTEETLSWIFDEE